MGDVKFVLLSSARSGTSHLGSTLRGTDGIYFHGEIFHPNLTWHVRDEYKTDRDVTLRDRDPIAYVEDIYSYRPPGTTHVGFKMWRSQSPEACDYVLADESVRKIILERENRLAAYASGAKAQASGVWNLAEGRKVKPAYADVSIDNFNPDNFLSFVKGQDYLFQQYVEKAKGPTIRLTYGQVADDSAYEICLEFLGLAMPEQRPAGKSKLNSNDILSRFAEPERQKVLEAVAAAGHPEWVTEA